MPAEANFMSTVFPGLVALRGDLSDAAVRATATSMPALTLFEFRFIEMDAEELVALLPALKFFCGNLYSSMEFASQDWLLQRGVHSRMDNEAEALSLPDDLKIRLLSSSYVLDMLRCCSLPPLPPAFQAPRLRVVDFGLNSDVDDEFVGSVVRVAPSLVCVILDYTRVTARIFALDEEEGELSLPLYGRSLSSSLFLSPFLSLFFSCSPRLCAVSFNDVLLLSLIRTSMGMSIGLASLQHLELLSFQNDIWEVNPSLNIVVDPQFITEAAAWHDNLELVRTDDDHNAVDAALSFFNLVYHRNLNDGRYADVPDWRKGGRRSQMSCVNQVFLEASGIAQGARGHDAKAFWREVADDFFGI